MELRWHDDTNLSVRLLFDLISHSCFAGSADAIPYERFISKAAFADAYEYLSDKRGIETIYIGCHGNADRLVAANKTEIDRYHLKSVVHQRRTSGLFLGCCDFVSEQNARFLMEDGSFLTWVAGYEEAVDWDRSTMLDGIFWMEYVKNDAEHRFHTHKKTNKIREVCDRLRINHRGLVDVLKFNVFMRTNIGSKEITNQMLLD